MKRLFASALVAGAAAVTALGAAAQDIGFVNMERILQESALGRAAQARLEERFGDRQRPLAEEEQAIRRLQQTLERDKPLMSRAQVEKKQQEIKERIQTFEEQVGELQREIMQVQQEEGNKILEPARKSVISIAEERKLSAVFEATQAGLLYLGEDDDITEAVIKRMDAETR
jgi:outer membrane protein